MVSVRGGTGMLLGSMKFTTRILLILMLIGLIYPATILYKNIKKMFQKIR